MQVKKTALYQIHYNIMIYMSQVLSEPGSGFFFFFFTSEDENTKTKLQTLHGNINHDALSVVWERLSHLSLIYSDAVAAHQIRH